MRTTTFIATLWTLSPLVHGLNILMGNDDGFGSANIREFYRLLKAAGHDVWMVAPATDQSGMGGRFALTTSPTLTTATEFNLVPAGAPSIGQDPSDSHIWYYNGTPSACTSVGLDYVLPTFANFSVPDLFVSGPNFGDNVGPFAYTGSGTIGATYTAIMRNIPGIAFSATNPTFPYTNLTNTTNTYTYSAELSVDLVSKLAKGTPKGQRLLPLGYGLNVDYPGLNTSCLKPPFVQSRFTGGAGLPGVTYNATSGLLQITQNNYFGLVPAGENTCYSGDCTLPGESIVVTACESAITIFTVDYDAPSNWQTEGVEKALGF